jgi:hypothetical protein
MEHIGDEIKPYALTIKVKKLFPLKKKTNSFMMFRKDESTKVRGSALLCLKKIIKKQYLDANEAEPKEMLDIFMKEINKSKPSASVKGGILLMLGVICDTFPEKVTESDRILKIFMDNLKKQSNSLNPEMSIVANSLKGISYFLRNFAKEVDEEESDYIKPLYGYLVKALEQSESTRYDVCKGNLNIFMLKSLKLV